MLRFRRLLLPQVALVHDLELGLEIRRDDLRVGRHDHEVVLVLVVEMVLLVYRFQVLFLHGAFVTQPWRTDELRFVHLLRLRLLNVF